MVRVKTIDAHAGGEPLRLIVDGFPAPRGKTMLELAFSWLAARPAVSSIIAGATSPEQLEANVGAAGWALSREDMDEIDRLTAN